MIKIFYHVTSQTRTGTDDLRTAPSDSQHTVWIL